jgi:hypothetical protein
MPVQTCPRCRRTNPAEAIYCYFDGVSLQSRSSGGPALAQLPQEFSFPSGRRCRTYEELAQACQEEWVAARELLRQGVFQRYFTAISCLDLVRAAQEAMTQSNLDIGLMQLLRSLPTQLPLAGPRLDLTPRRLHLGTLLAGEHRQIRITIRNQGQGLLQGTLAVSEGNEWLKLAGGATQLTVQTPREQTVEVHLDTRSLPAEKKYEGKLTLVTNGGVMEVPVKLYLKAHPFPKPPFQGVCTPRDMGIRMQSHPKAAAAILENGELAEWFRRNGWKYPISGPQVKGVAAVQQFYEVMGLARPPSVQLTPSRVQLTCTNGDKLRGQLTLHTTARKWVYGHVQCAAPWLHILTPSVSGPQRATITYEVDPKKLPGPQVEAVLQVVANAGQILEARVQVAAPGGGLRRQQPPVPAFLTLAALLALVRLLLALPAEGLARDQALAWASQVVLAQGQQTELPLDSPARLFAGWLQIPWSGLLLHLPQPPVPETLLGRPLSLAETRSFWDAFLRSFLAWMMGLTAWLGIPLWFCVLRRRDAAGLDLIWGTLAGAVLGLLGAASLGCLVLLGDLPLQILWDLTLCRWASPVLLPLWVLLAALTWAGWGLLGGMVLAVFPGGRRLLQAAQALLVQLCRLCRLRGLAATLAAQ